ncbi:MAG: NAD(P)H-dependent flavin oxidoreductase [Oscillospiraceae bacterium]
MKTKLTEMFGIEYPIVQSGMRVASRAAARLTAVCNAGGIGTINVTCWPTLDEFADALDEMNSLTNKPYIVNISLAPTQRLDNEEIRKTIRLCGEKHVAAIETSAEDPREFIADIKSAGMRHFHKCPNYKVSMSMERKGLDGVIIAGYEVGGHPSADGVGTFVIARRCAADMKIRSSPPAASPDGHGLAAALALGASGVAMGTRFVCVDECPISDNHRQWVINHTERDTVLCQKTIGSMMRVSKNNASCSPTRSRTAACAPAGPDGHPQGADARHHRPEDPRSLPGRQCRQRDLLRRHGMGLVHDVVPVKVLLDRMVKEAEETINSIKASF